MSLSKYGRYQHLTHRWSLFFCKPTYITADSKVKNRFALGMPTSCNKRLSMMFEDQLVALNEIVKSEQDLEDKVWPAYDYIVNIS